MNYKFNLIQMFSILACSGLPGEPLHTRDVVHPSCPQDPKQKMQDGLSAGDEIVNYVEHFFYQHKKIPRKDSKEMRDMMDGKGFVFRFFSKKSKFEITFSHSVDMCSVQCKYVKNFASQNGKQSWSCYYINRPPFQ